MLTITATGNGRACLAAASFRVAVHRVPRGAYAAVLQARTDPGSGDVAAPTVLARANIAVP